MKIRSKLIYLYVVIIAALVIVGSFSIWAVLSWNDAAQSLAAIHTQSITAERIRATVYQQVGYGSDYLLGDIKARDLFDEARGRVEELLGDLRENSKSAIESDHIIGLEETRIELNWIVERLFDNSAGASSYASLQRSLERLREIADEVADDITALNQYYVSLEYEMLAEEANAGRLVMIIIIAAVVMALALFTILVFLLERWLVQPIQLMNNAAYSISSGNLDIAIEIKSRDEWAQLSQSVNEMVDSLKRSQERLRNQERLATLGEIAAYAAHNTRNPLAGIRAAGQVLISHESIKGTEIEESINEIIATVDRLDGWLIHLLEYAKPLKLDIASTDINTLIRQATMLTLKPFQQNGINIEWHLADDLPLASIDPILIEQTVAVIATNAFQAVENNGKLIIKTELDTGNNSDRIIIRFTDNGVGIAEDIQPKLFKIFVSGKEKGIGLGLAQAKKIVYAHGGDISLESTQGQGTTVTISLPVNYAATD